ncbi:MAG: site-specific integrase [Odoribacteraceae bacterium]|jgi:integrase|nr:site-specific integrase [Odoribacteraceae bacterium]
MAKFKAEWPHRQVDGSRSIRLRVTHRGEERRFSTGLVAAPGDFTKGGKLKDARLVEAVSDLLKKCREACNEAGTRLATMSVDEVVKAIRARFAGDGDAGIDFVRFAREAASRKAEGTRAIYASAINALIRYAGRDSIDIGELNARFVQGFIDFVAAEPSRRDVAKGKEREPKRGRAVSLYVACLKAAHNEAKRVYNDEDAGIVRVPLSPFKGRRMPVERLPAKRAIPVATMQKIIDDRDLRGRESLARDAFLLSFGLAGMNSADLLECPPPVDGVISYNRRKTRTRRADGAPARVRVEACLSELVEARGDGRRAFNFYKSFPDHKAFNKAINEGLKAVGERAGVPGLTFYAARHSWATIARSSAVNADKATVHEALCHVDPAMKITDTYVERDWSVAWDVNARVLALFDWYSIL